VSPTGVQCYLALLMRLQQTETHKSVDSISNTHKANSFGKKALCGLFVVAVDQRN
jgi:hypothetical protein